MRTRSTHYDSLKVAPDAPPEVVRAAYKALAQKFHPDRNADPNATSMMVLVNDAYRVLSNPELRREYDCGLELERREHRAPEERKSTAPRTARTTRAAAPAADPPPRAPGPEILGKTVDLEAVWKAWFGKASPTQRPSQEEARSPRTTRPPGSRTVDLDETWRNLFGSSGSAGRSKRGNRE